MCDILTVKYYLLASDYLLDLTGGMREKVPNCFRNMVLMLVAIILADLVLAQIGKRFIKQYHIRFDHQRTSQRDTLLLTP